MNSVTKKPDLTDPVLRAKLAKGMGHNYYGEPAWPNDLLYIFPVVILGTIALSISLAVMEPTALGEPADPFATPLEILPEWYFFPTFNALRVMPNNLFGMTLNALKVGKKYHSGKISNGVANGSAGSPNAVGSITAKEMDNAMVPKITTGKMYNKSF